MKFFVTLFLLTLFAFACAHNETAMSLIKEQKRLKDSANVINERIGIYIQKGIYDSAEAQKKQLGAVHARLAEIQTSIDSRSRTNQ